MKYFYLLFLILFLLLIIKSEKTKNKFKTNKKYKILKNSNKNENNFKKNNITPLESHAPLNYQETGSGCQGAGLCCQGKNNKCVAKGNRMNKKNNKTCYCDSNCFSLGDCCLDYLSYCPKVNCEAGNWGQWSECDVTCGFGARYRERRIMREAQNGGKKCGKLKQQKYCEGKKCKQTRNSENSFEEIRETGRILGTRFGGWRFSSRYDPLRDVRKNIFEKNGFTLQNEDKKSCHIFKLKYITKSCNKKNLKKNKNICLECQKIAKREDLGGRCHGQGVFQVETKWVSMETAGCRGSWILEKQEDDCSCNEKFPNLESYVFV